MGFIKLLFWFLIVFVGLLFFQTWRVQHNSLEAQFLKGSVPKPVLNGTYKGTFDGMSVPIWNGKRFDAKNNVGINVLAGKDHIPFKTVVANGVWDKNKKVLVLDYDVSHNIFFIKPIEDEVVQVKPGQYLGKVNIRLIPGFPFSLGYFWLKK